MLGQIFRHVVLFLAAILSLASIDACSLVVAGDPITANIVDAETNAPLAGVHVLALWELKGGLEGGNVVGIAKVMEAETDSNGVFRFPGWGPKLVSPFGSLPSAAPLIMFFKSGYDYQQVHNQVSAYDRPHTSSEWNGKTIRLAKFKGTADQYALVLGEFRTQIDSAFHADPCVLVTIPKILKALSDQGQALGEGRIGSPVRPYSVDRLDRMLSEKGCPSLKSKMEAVR